MQAPKTLEWPDGLDQQAFLTDYWQQRPLLLPRALPGFETPLPADELAGLALEDDTTPRLVLKSDDDNYTIEHGPFDETRFSDLQDNNWSLLVTDVEKHIPELAAWLQPFRFLPGWRIDDLMISYAPPGASVGAHVDEYDVFLLQASGTRHWQIDTINTRNHELKSDSSIKLLANFTPDQSHDLHPGDMLYLPPGVPHHGIAASEDCTTWSIGFRAPAHAEIVAEFAEMIASNMHAQRYTDPAIATTQGQRSGEINQASLNEFARIWRAASTLDDASLAELTGRLLSQPPALDIERYEQSSGADNTGRWVKHPFSRFAFIDTATAANTNASLFVDGEMYACSAELAEQLCAGDAVSMPDCEGVDKQVLQALIQSCGVVSTDPVR